MYKQKSKSKRNWGHGVKHIGSTEKVVSKIMVLFIIMWFIGKLRVILGQITKCMEFKDPKSFQLISSSVGD